MLQFCAFVKPLKERMSIVNYYQPERETASRDQITAWQTEGLINTVNRLYDNVPLYDRGISQGAEKLHLCLRAAA